MWSKTRLWNLVAELKALDWSHVVLFSSMFKSFDQLNNLYLVHELIRHLDYAHHWTIQLNVHLYCGNLIRVHKWEWGWIPYHENSDSFGNCGMKSLIEIIESIKCQFYSLAKNCNDSKTRLPNVNCSIFYQKFKQKFS